MPHIGETAEDLPETLFETAPTVLFTVPRYLQKMAAQRAGADGKHLGAQALRLRPRHGLRAGACASGAGRARPAGRPRSCKRCGSALVFRPVLNKIGFDKLELVVSGGAPLPAETMAVWHMLGVNVCEMYGQTETAGGIIAGQRGPFPRPGDVGTIPEGFEVKLADDGEILVRSPDLFEGYWNNARSVRRRARRRRAGCARATSASGATARCELIDRARDFLVTIGRQDHLAVVHREHRCARARTSPRSWCSATAASISPR